MLAVVLIYLSLVSATNTNQARENARKSVLEFFSKGPQAVKWDDMNPDCIVHKYMPKQPPVESTELLLELKERIDEEIKSDAQLDRSGNDDDEIVSVLNEKSKGKSLSKPSIVDGQPRVVIESSRNDGPFHRNGGPSRITENNSKETSSNGPTPVDVTKKVNNALNQVNDVITKSDKPHKAIQQLLPTESFEQAVKELTIEDDPLQLSVFHGCPNDNVMPYETTLPLQWAEKIKVFFLLSSSISSLNKDIDYINSAVWVGRNDSLLSTYLTQWTSLRAILERDRRLLRNKPNATMTAALIKRYLSVCWYSVDQLGEIALLVNHTSTGYSNQWPGSKIMDSLVKSVSKVTQLASVPLLNEFLNSVVTNAIDDHVTVFLHRLVKRKISAFEMLLFRRRLMLHIDVGPLYVKDIGFEIFFATIKSLLPLASWQSLTFAGRIIGLPVFK